jgi:very-short-patch-repair endonuclease
MEDFFVCTVCNEKLEGRSKLIKHNFYQHNVRAPITILNYCYNGVVPKCKCGCGKNMGYWSEKRAYKEWKLGHISKIKNNYNSEKSIKNSAITRREKSKLGLLKNSPETKLKKSIARLGDKNPMYGKTHTNEVKEKLKTLQLKLNEDPEFREANSKRSTLYWSDPKVRQDQAERRSKWMQEHPYQFKPSKLEERLANYFNEWGVSYKRQQRLYNKVFDFTISNTNIIIEVDGDFWHCNPKLFPNGPQFKCQVDAVLNDQRKNILLKEKGYKLIRLWEDDINNNINIIKEQILNEIRLSNNIKK